MSIEKNIKAKNYDTHNWRDDFHPIEIESVDIIKPEPLISIGEGNRTRYKGISILGSGNKKDLSKGPNEKAVIDYTKIQAKAPITNDGKKKVNPKKNEVISASKEYKSFSTFYETATAVKKPNFLKRTVNSVVEPTTRFVKNFGSAKGRMNNLKGTGKFGKSLLKYEVKDRIARAVKPTLKKLAGKNQVAKTAIDVGTEVAPFFSYRKGAKMVSTGAKLLAKPLLGAAALTLADQRPAGPKDEKAMMKASMDPKSPLYKKPSEVKK